MLTDLLLILIYPILFVLKGIYFALPDFDFLGSILTPITQAFDWFYGVVYSLNPILPYTTIQIVLGTVVSYYVLLFSYRGVSWTLRKLPFINLS